MEPRRDIGRQRYKARIEAQLRGGRELVDVLSARSGSTDEADLDVVLVDREVAGNPQHGVTGSRDDPWRESDSRRIAFFWLRCCMTRDAFPGCCAARRSCGVVRC